MRNKILMTLALLLTAVTGAWATTDPNSVSWENQTWKGWAENVTTHTVGDITITCSGNAKAYEATDSGEPLALQAGANDAITFTSNGKPFASISIMTPVETQVTGWTYNSPTFSLEWSGEPTTSVTLSGCDIKADVITFTFGTAEPALTVEWNPATKTGNFNMPAYDVELTPIYAPVAQWAKVENVDQLPTAIEGVIADTDAPLIVEGTVAFAGTSTEVKQGTVMYAVTPATVTEAPALDAANKWSADVPTAKLVADGGIDVLVWYYIKGADTPEGQEATAENTFNDSEICTEPIKVTVLSNKFDIQFKAANDNTIEAGKATVTVGGTAATVTEGKLEGVKMGSEVKLKANTGYKFRKVEVKKKGAKADPSETITFSGGKNANYTYTGTHFSATGEADPTDGTFELNKWSSVTINATDGKTITKVVFSYRENGNNDLDQLSFSSGTFDGIDTVNDVNATMLSVTSTTVGATKLNGVTIYYK